MNRWAYLVNEVQILNICPLRCEDFISFLVGLIQELNWLRYDILLQRQIIQSIKINDLTPVSISSRSKALWQKNLLHRKCSSCTKVFFSLFLKKFTFLQCVNQEIRAQFHGSAYRQILHLRQTIIPRLRACAKFPSLVSLKCLVTWCTHTCRKHRFPCLR